MKAARPVRRGADGKVLRKLGVTRRRPTLHDSEDKRTEHAFLTHCTRYLADSGLLVFIVPRQRLGGLGPLPVHPLRADALLGLP